MAKGKNTDAKRHISLILEACRSYGITDRSHIAYVLASAHHESNMGKTMSENCGGNHCDRYEKQPLKSQLGNKHKGDGRWFRGRGYVQLTGRKNYERYSLILGVDMGGDGTGDIKYPRRALKPENAAKIVAHGMKHGTYNEVHKLADFGRDGSYDFKGARKIINKQLEVAKVESIAKKYRKAMNP